MPAPVPPFLFSAALLTGQLRDAGQRLCELRFQRLHLRLQLAQGHTRNCCSARCGDGCGIRGFCRFNLIERGSGPGTDNTELSQTMRGLKLQNRSFGQRTEISRRGGGKKSLRGEHCLKLRHVCSRRTGHEIFCKRECGGCRWLRYHRWHRNCRCNSRRSRRTIYRHR